LACLILFEMCVDIGTGEYFSPSDCYWSCPTQNSFVYSHLYTHVN
jgi:hypothetical protein